MVPVVVIDADEKSFSNLSRLLTSAGVDARLFSSPSGYFDDKLFKAAHVAVINLSLPDFDGLDVLKFALENSKAIAVFASINGADTEKTVLAMRLGAQSVFEKPIRAEQIISAALGTSEQRSKTISNQLRKRLTNREQEVLQALLANETNKDIAERLGISARTIETHRAKLYAKLNVNNHSELIKKWTA